ncbi:MAG: glycosyltransferase 87 family protein [Acidimicrobiales bacterium]
MARLQALAAGVITSVVKWATGLPVLRQDALLYAMAGIFAAGETVLAVTADYREWGQIAVGPYLAAGIICEVTYRRRRRSELPAADSTGTTSKLRRALTLSVLALAVLLPLALQVTWRANARTATTNPHGAQAQPEVAVIERAGDRFAHFQDPYLAHPRTVGVSPSNDHKAVNANSYFPYLPGMVLFGLANAAKVPLELNDARVALAGFTLLVVALALWLAPASSRRRWRAFQFFLVLPTGALPIVTGGDDLPVLGLLLLGLVMVSRRRPVTAGLIMGIAGTLKWTAWPLVLLAVLCVRDEDDHPAVLRYLVSVLLVAVPVIGAGIALGPHAFVENVIMFPLGLTKVHSPAASPLPGQVLVQLLPAYKKMLTMALIGIGAVTVGVALLRHPPRTADAAARFSGWALAFATFIAPATRFGYLIYPANMLVWAYLLRSPPACQQGGEPLASQLSKDGVLSGAIGADSGVQLASSTW